MRHPNPAAIRARDTVDMAEPARYRRAAKNSKLRIGNAAEFKLTFRQKSASRHRACLKQART
jgi:hypothetical protein